MSEQERIEQFLASERFAVEELSDQIASEFSSSNDSQFEVWASQEESDPIIWA